MNLTLKISFAALIIFILSLFFLEKVPSQSGLFYRVNSINVEYQGDTERVTLYRKFPSISYAMLFFFEKDGLTYIEEENNYGAFAKFRGSYHHPLNLFSDGIIDESQMSKLKYKFRVEETVVIEFEKEEEVVEPIPNDVVIDEDIFEEISDVFYVEGRPEGTDGNSFLIGDKEMLKGYIWIEITEDTDTTGTVLGNEEWGEYWRQRYKVEIDEIDKSSYPYRAEAISVSVDYSNNGRISGVVTSFSDNGFTITGFYHRIFWVSLDENTEILIEGYEGKLSDILSEGDIIEFEHGMILESFPGSTTATVINSITKFELPVNVVDYFGTTEVYFKGMVTRELIPVPLFMKSETECAETASVYKEFKLLCESFDSYAVIYDNEVIGLEASFESGIIHPNDLQYTSNIYFVTNYDYFNDAEMIAEYEDEAIHVIIQSVQDVEERFFINTTIKDKDAKQSYGIQISKVVQGVEEHYRYMSIYRMDEIEQIQIVKGILYRLYIDDILVKEFIG